MMDWSKEYYQTGFMRWFDEHCIGKTGTNRRGYSSSYNNVYGEFRDEIERITVDKKYRNLTYRLWHTPIFSLHIDSKLKMIDFGSWDSCITRDRLNSLARYFNMPFSFKMIEGQLYCCYGGTEVLFHNVCADLVRNEFVVEVVGTPYYWYDVVPLDKSKLRNIEQFEEWI